MSTPKAKTATEHVFEVPGHGKVRVYLLVNRPAESMTADVSPANRPWLVAYAATVAGEDYNSHDFTVPAEHVNLFEPLSRGVAAALLDAIGFRFGHPWLCEYAAPLRAFGGR
jgi:hypothetical protein